MGAGISGHSAGLLPDANLLHRRHLEDGLHLLVRRLYQLRLHPVVRHLEEPVLPARRPDQLRRPGRRLRIPSPETAQVYNGFLELVGGAGGGEVGVGPQELGGQSWLGAAAEHGGENCGSGNGIH